MAMSAPVGVGSVVTVGAGRGFVAEVPARGMMGGTERVIITASHCLPHLPPQHPASYTNERTYLKLLATIDRAPSIAAECYFADPVADLAILGTPDTQELSDQADLFEALVDSVEPFDIGPAELGEAWCLSLEGTWRRGMVANLNRALVVTWELPVVGGMSGSPIIQGDRAIGVITTGQPGFEPVLVDMLPAWALTPARPIAVLEADLRHSIERDGPRMRGK